MAVVTGDMTTTEAARYLGLARKTITAYVASGLIQAEKHGRDYLISAREIERFAQTPRPMGRPPVMKKR